MTDKEILQKVCDKIRDKVDYRYNPDIIFKNKGYYSIIFQQEFAKAFWHDSEKYNDNDIRHWKGRLQQMVLEKEPLKYLERYL